MQLLKYFQSESVHRMSRTDHGGAAKDAQRANNLIPEVASTKHSETTERVSHEVNTLCKSRVKWRPPQKNYLTYRGAQYIRNGEIWGINGRIIKRGDRTDELWREAELIENLLRTSSGRYAEIHETAFQSGAAD